VRRTSGAGTVINSLRAVRGARGLDRFVATLQDGQDGYQARDVEDPLDPRLHALADADDVALAGLDRAPARVQQRTQDRGVDEDI